MSIKPEPDQAPAWSEAQTRDPIALRRRNEHLELQKVFEQKYESLRARLVNQYDRRSTLQTELQAVSRTIHMHEQDQERLSVEWDTALHQLNQKFAEEDRQQQMYAAQDRERAEANGNGRPGSARGTSTPQSGGWTSINGSRGRKREDEELPIDAGNIMSGTYQSADDGHANGKPLPFRPNGSGMDIDESDASLAGRSRPLKPKQQQQQQQQQQQRHSLPGFHSEASRDSPVDPKGRSPSGRRSLPGARSHSQAPHEPNPADHIEINRDTIELKDNGIIYTEPPMYAGVPLARIAPEHEYWDPEWLPLEDHIMPQLEQWQQKLDKLRQDKSAVRHTVFLANRQVNRGQAIIDYLKSPNPEFHPYQYVGKEMMVKFYKTFINYDTMFRLINVHEELKKFDLDVTPLEWLRQRMYEVSTAQGDKFNLSKYTHDLYHDSKLKVLREKHGFGNIGRPSGYKVGEKNPDKGKAKQRREQMGLTSRRSKARRSIGQVDMDDSQSIDGYPQHPQQEYLDPLTPRMQKRARIEEMTMMPQPIPQHMPHQMLPPMQQPQQPQQVVDDLEYDGWSSTDSFSAGTISHLDWRIHQIKTPQLTTSSEVTQYWTYKKESRTFLHQVLRDVHPKVIWGVYQKPLDFDLKLDELIEAQYSSGNLRVAMQLRDPARPTVLAQFKRERTKRRFLAFLRKQNINVTKIASDNLDDAWEAMKGEELTGEE
ncbi:hypothetical protein TruAng_003672 [Truncatella angustata]|nr:hypothetical protein TruAng_003672 [Truncatella angustata]